jgi:lipopolysaccharide/colanic/teichoic acid biosynthesis glycosyltransferase
MKTLSPELARQSRAAFRSPGEAMATAAGCRALDLVLGTALLVLLLPLLLLIALAIRLESPGSPVFSQRRFGRRMTGFTVYKFRTMYHDRSSAVHRDYVIGLIRGDRVGSSNDDGGLYKLQRDERVTRIGRFLRRTSLDELPQLWNVVRGQMSLVGPRPVIPYEVEHYPTDWYERFSVRPGLTGLWQVSGRSRLSYEQMVHLDREYVHCRSFWLNVVILARTPLAVAHAKDAA